LHKPGAEVARPHGAADGDEVVEELQEGTDPLACLDTYVMLVTERRAINHTTELLLSSEQRDAS
jgi:hypothetical protein